MKASFDLLENNRVIINHERENATPEEPNDRGLSPASSGGSPGPAAGETGGVDVRFLDHQGDPAGEITLDRPRCGGDPVANVVAVQQVVQCKTLLIVGEKNIPAGDISH